MCFGLGGHVSFNVFVFVCMQASAEKITCQGGCQAVCAADCYVHKSSMQTLIQKLQESIMP